MQSYHGFSLPKIDELKNDYYGFEPTKMHYEFMHKTNSFQIRFDKISNTKGKKEIAALEILILK